MANFPKTNMYVGFDIQRAIPIDVRTYFDSYDEALEAAQKAEPAGSTKTKYYYGMRITVVENGEVNHYTITPQNTLQPERGVFNADTHYDFPSVGSVDMIYKAQAEKLIYQWNPTELKYEALGASEEINTIELINGGNANG